MRASWMGHLGAAQVLGGMRAAGILAAARRALQVEPRPGAGTRGTAQPGQKPPRHPQDLPVSSHPPPLPTTHGL